ALRPARPRALGQNVSWLTLTGVLPRVCVLLARPWVLLARLCVPPARPCVLLARPCVLLARPWVLPARSPYHRLSPRRPPRRRTRPVSPSQRSADCRGSRSRARRDCRARLARAAAGPLLGKGAVRARRPTRLQSVGLERRHCRRCSSID